MAGKPLTFYFDFISPYAWLAWNRIHLLADAHQRRVKPVPILLAGALNHYGHLGPAEIPPKREYVMKDVLRVGAMTGIPVGVPPAHPFNPLLALRVASIPLPEDQRRQVIHALFAAVWAGGGPGVEDPAVVAELVSGAGADGPALVEAAGTPQIKAMLREATEAAVGAGVFGVPTTAVDGELFWGFDAFVHIDRFLRGQDPVKPELVGAWRDLPATARRK
jgi:2-hydroxychromene-2-carboxylate isomerase